MKKNNFVGKVFITNNSKETQKLGHDFAKILKKGDVVCLIGALGSGKTTFVQGLAKGFGIKNRIISPTFVIVRQYNLESQISNLKTKSINLKSFYHIDLYRIEGKKNIENLGFGEIINNKNNIIIIEWAEKLGSQSPKKRINIEFSYEKNDARKIIFRPLNQ